MNGEVIVIAKIKRAYRGIYGKNHDEIIGRAKGLFDAWLEENKTYLTGEILNVMTMEEKENE